MAQIQLPTGESVDIPDDISPELGARLRKYVNDQRHSSEEFSPPKKESRKLTPAASKLESQVQAATEEGPTGLLKGIGETALSGISSLGSTAIGGLAGAGRAAYSLASGEGLEKAAQKGTETIRNVQESGTYQPRSAAGQVLTGAVGELASVPGRVGSAIGGAVGQAVGGEKGRLAGESIGEVAPSIVPLAGAARGAITAGLKPKAVGSSRGAKLLNDALEDFTPEELQQADALLKKSHEEGVPLTGPEALATAPKMRELVTKVDKSNSVVSNFLKQRPEQARAAIRQRLAQVGENVGSQEAANAMQEAADTSIGSAQKFRTEAAGPDYRAQRASDKETLQLVDQIGELQKSIGAGEKWQNDAVQQAGKWYQYQNEMTLKAQATRGKVKSASYMERAVEGREAVTDAVNEARRRRDFINNWKDEVDQKADKLATRDTPMIQARVNGFVNDLNAKIRLAGPEEATVLQNFRDQIAPNGKPLVLPSQLESVYKASRDKLDLGIQATSAERTAAGVLKNNVKDLDYLIQEVSPAIKQGREIYAQMSKDVVDPLMKGPVGRIAGRGAEAQKEAVQSRLFSELQSEIATPSRIRTLADSVNKVNKEAFPNAVRSWLESRFNKSSEIKVGGDDRLLGAQFAEKIAGSPKERDNLATMIEKSAEAQGSSVAEARASARGFNNLIEVLQASGRLPKLGTRGVEESAGVGESLAGAAMHGPSISTAKTIAESVSNFLKRKDYKRLAEVFTSPDAISEMQKLSKLPTIRKAEREELVANILNRAVETGAAKALAPKTEQPEDDEEN